MSKEEKSSTKKIKILFHSDSPRCSTGFGRIIFSMCDYLAKTGKYEIDIFGVNDLGFLDPDPEKYPYRILPAMIPGIQGDFYGRIRFINIIRGADRNFLTPPWDIIFTLNDPFIFEEPVLTPEIGMMDALKDLQLLYRKDLAPEAWFTTASYWPVDSSLKENWITHAIGHPDYSVAYTNYGKSEIEKTNNKLEKPLKLNLSVIYHGTDTESFHPISEEEKKEFKKKFFRKAKIDTDRTYIVGIVARNQMRKDLPRAMKIFKEFQKRRPDSMLYVHAKENDVWGSLGEYARNFNLELGKDWIFPGNFNENVGYPTDALNKIYNIMDVQIQTTLGEGHGNCITEAMAAGTLNLAPNITSIPELFNTSALLSTSSVGKDIEVEDIEIEELRGIPFKALSTTSEWATYGPTDYERIRPLTNVDDAVKKLLWVYDNPEKVKPIVDRAHEWIQQYSWTNIGQKWDEFFTKVYENLEEERKLDKKKIKKDEGQAPPSPSSFAKASEDKKAMEGQEDGKPTA